MLCPLALPLSFRVKTALITFCSRQMATRQRATQRTSTKEEKKKDLDCFLLKLYICDQSKLRCAAKVERAQLFLSFPSFHLTTKSMNAHTVAPMHG